MKKSLSILCLLACTLFASAEEKELSLSLGASYANQVFVKLGTDSVTTIAASAWDVMFNRTSSYSFDVRVNDARMQVYQVSNNYNSSVTTAQWDSVDISDQTAWTQLYNNDSVWAEGAFGNMTIPSGTSGYPQGWGYYDLNTHHILGSAVFVLKYTTGIYRKFKIDDFYGGYTISYSTWDATNSLWGTTTTSTILNTTGTGYSYNFFSFDTGSVVSSIPADDYWDFVFTQYYTNLGIMYKVTGVLQGYSAKVAKGTDAAVPASSDYSSIINTIGYDWKTYSGSSYVTKDTVKYYVKSSDSTIYKVWFTSFSGSTTGDLVLKYTTDLSTSSISGTMATTPALSFKYLPASKELVLQDASASSNVTIFSLTGQKVFGTTVSESTISLANLKSGIYIVLLQSGSESKQDKIVVID
jgi:hypothetical protein